MIELTKNYAISADTRCFTICRRRTKKGKSIWEAEFYFTSLEHVFEKLVTLAIVKGIQKGSWEDVLKEVIETKQMIREKMALLTSLEMPS